MSDTSEKKVGVFIDYENVHICLKENSKAFKLDKFCTFRDKTAEFGKLIMIKSFAVWDYLHDQQKAFDEEAIKTVSIFSDLKNATDITLAVECLAAVHEGKINTVIIFSGDGGYAPLVNYLIDELGIDVYVLSVNNGCHTKVYNRLKKKHILIDEMFKEDICDISEISIDESIIKIVCTLHKFLTSRDFMARGYFIKYLENNPDFRGVEKDKLGKLIDESLTLSLINTKYRPNPKDPENPTRVVEVNYEHPLVIKWGLKK